MGIPASPKDLGIEAPASCSGNSVRIRQTTCRGTVAVHAVTAGRKEEAASHPSHPKGRCHREILSSSSLALPERASDPDLPCSQQAARPVLGAHPPIPCLEKTIQKGLGRILHAPLQRPCLIPELPRPARRLFEQRFRVTDHPPQLTTEIRIPRLGRLGPPLSLEPHAEPIGKLGDEA